MATEAMHKPEVRRPGSPIAGLKHNVLHRIALRLRCQKAWKPDCGIETPRNMVLDQDTEKSEGLEARLRD